MQQFLYVNFYNYQDHFTMYIPCKEKKPVNYQFFTTFSRLFLTTSDYSLQCYSLSASVTQNEVMDGWEHHSPWSTLLLRSRFLMENFNLHTLHSGYNLELKKWRKYCQKNSFSYFFLANMQCNHNQFNISWENRWFVPCSGIS